MPRLWIPLLVLFLIFSAIVVRLGQLQLFMHGKLTSTTNREVVHKTVTRPLRGRVLDRAGRLLAVSLERPSIFVFKRDLQISQASLVQAIHRLLASVSVPEAIRKLRGPSSFVWMKRLAEVQEGDRIKKAKIQGVGIEYEGKRFYPWSPVAKELIGDVGLDGDGANGLERGLEPLLDGDEETRIVLKDALGKIFSERASSSLASSVPHGKAGPFDIYLTLDIALQALAERHAQEALLAHGAQKAMVVVQEIATGAVLVLASKGATDPSRVKDLDPNYAFSYTFEPGSVMKPFVLAASLDAGVVNENETIDCENGKYRLTPTVVIEDHEPRGILKISEILAYSSNIGMAKIGMRLGQERLYDSLGAFGFGSKTALPLTGESVGILGVPSSWSKTSLPMISFGQEIGVTAIQLVGAFSAMANEGRLLEPQIIAAIQAARSEKLLYSFQPRKIRQVLPAKIARKTLAMMEEVTRYGTGVKAQIPGYPVAGKTGTAQKIDPATRKYSRTKVVVSFCGVFPMPKPAFSICAILDEPTKPKVAWASDIAAPLFKAVAEDTINFLSLSPTEVIAAQSGKNEKKLN